jgi:hypothetical protein
MATMGLTMSNEFVHYSRALKEEAILDVPDSDNVRNHPCLDIDENETDFDTTMSCMQKLYKREHICFGGKIIEKIIYLRNNRDGTTTKCCVFGEEIDMIDIRIS